MMVAMLCATERRESGERTDSDRHRSRSRVRRCRRKSRSGLVAVNRYYDPITGQFMSVDPLVTKTHQAYVYTSDNPVNISDPTGALGSRASEHVEGTCGTSFMDVSAYASGRVSADIGFFDLCFDADFVSATAWFFDVSDPINPNNWYPSVEITSLAMRRSYHHDFARSGFGSGNDVFVLPGLEAAGIRWSGWFESIPIPDWAVDLLHPLEVEIP